MDDLSQDARLEELRAQHCCSTDTLVKISQRLTLQGTSDATQWLKDIDRINRHDNKTNIVIGIVGATGAGKSALINALLNEERILPTNCMRACTAVVTEIAYNDQDTPYRAEIHFIGKEAWHAELTAMLGDITDETGQFSSSVYRENTEAGIAYAKVRAVYPQMKREDIVQASVDELVSRGSVKILGTIKTIEEYDVDKFYASLQKFVDSKEKVQKLGSRAQKRPEDPSAIEYWPLIKVVKIYIKAPILQTGAVLVDLPGVQDSNVARAAIAQNYLKQCASLIIVAPINRAVDDKAAKSLLGDTFKQQLKLDGSFSNIIFVCSKTDEISLSEAHDSLDLAYETGDLYQRLKEIETLDAEGDDQCAQLTAKIKNCKTILKKIQSEIAACRSLRRRIEQGAQRFLSPITTYFQKRKVEPEPVSRPAKKLRIDSHLDDSSDQEDSETDGDSVIGTDFATTASLSNETSMDADAIDAKLARLQEAERSTSSELNEHQGKLGQELATARKRKQEASDIHQNLYKISIQARNDYAKEAIKADFAMGIKEMDENLAQAADPDSFDPSVEQRDYGEVARKLPVFCISSRGYQKLQGRLKKEKSAPGYTSISDTEIPALQAHCNGMTRELRTRAYEDFLNKYTQFCNSLRLWASGRNGDRNLTEAELEMAQKTLIFDSRKMSKEIATIGHEVFCDAAQIVDNNIYGRFDAAITQAQIKADEIQARWNGANDPASLVGQGLRWNTYKATVRRNGTFGQNDFNNDLATPIKDILTHGWETTFVRGIPMQLSNFVDVFESELARFHDTACQTAERYGASENSLKMLIEQLVTYTQSVRTTVIEICKQLKAGQKEITRQFDYCISDEMRATYQQCANQVGLGMLMRMRREMNMGLSASKRTMFHSSTQHIRQQIEYLLAQIRREFTEQVRAVTDNVERDYTNLFGQQGQARLEQQKLFRQNLIAILDGTPESDMAAANDSAEPEAGIQIPAQSWSFEAADRPVQIKAEPGSTTGDMPHSMLAFRSATPDSRRAS